jgi:hypothetical protein
VDLIPNRCPADPAETAEGYIMDTLDDAEAEAFEEHCLVCRGCLAVLEETERYVRAMRIATRRRRTDTEGATLKTPSAYRIQ